MTTVGPESGRFRVVVASGARAAEAAALAAVDDLLDARPERRPWSTPPILVLVPSALLRRQFLRRLAARGGPAACGLRCTTVHSFALELLGRLPAEPRALLRLLIERRAAAEPALRDLGRLHRGFAAVAPAVDDLLEAGFSAPLLEGALDALRGPDAAAEEPAARARAAGVLAVAAAVDGDCRRAGLPVRHRLYPLAAEALAALPPGALGPVVVHGFAAPGALVTEFLIAALHHGGGALIVDRPPNPLDPAALAADGRGSQAILDRATSWGRTFTSTHTPEASPCRLLGCLRPEDEVDEIAHRILDRIEAGVAPEDLAVVLRRAEPHALLLRQRFHALGVPFSAHGLPGVALPHRRRLQLLPGLLEQAGLLPLDRWIAACPALAATAADILLACAARGVVRLRDAAALELPGDDEARLPLPLRRVRSGVTAEDDEEDADGDETPVEDSDLQRAPASLRLGDLRRGLVAASRTLELATRLDSRMPLADHLERLDCLVAEGLLWGPDDPARVELASTTAAAAEAVPEDWDLEGAEFRTWLEEALATSARGDLGGHGAGVQLVDLVSFRGCTAEEIWVPGAQRGVYPRHGEDDPMLSDLLRDLLAAGGTGPLPDLTGRREAGDAETHVFAQLLSAAPRITLSWAEADVDGHPLVPSPWIERLALHGHPRERRRHGLWDEPGAQPEARLLRRPPNEWLRLAALHGGRSDLGALLPLALAQHHDVAPARLAQWAEVQMAVLNALDPALQDPRNRRTGPGPYSGMLGRPPALSEGPLWVTGYEALARCPWQSFLQRGLRLEPWLDPVLELPDLDALLVGQFVHSVLADIFSAAGAPEEVELDSLDPEAARTAPWPPGPDLERRMQRHAADTLAAAGIHLPGLVDGLVVRGRPYLERARETLWRDGSEPRVLGAEVRGHARIGDREIRFRADAVLAGEDGWQLVDFKTGRLPTVARTESTRHKHLLRAVRRGTHLQAAVYAQAVAPSLAIHEGSYWSLTPPAADGQNLARLSVRRDDAEVREALGTTLNILEEALASAILPARLLERHNNRSIVNPACRHCEVARACHQGDSGARRRYEVLMEHPRTGAGSGTNALGRRLVRLARLGADDGTEPVEDDA